VIDGQRVMSDKPSPRLGADSESVLAELKQNNDRKS
jgi:hypothetical protein